MRVQRHRHHGVVADERRELDHAHRLETLQRLAIGRIAHRIVFVQLVGVIVNREVIGVGVGLGIALASRLVAYIGREFPEIVFTVPWGQIGGIALFAYLAALLTTSWPAWRAGRVEPAQALRYE